MAPDCSLGIFCNVKIYTSSVWYVQCCSVTQDFTSSLCIIVNPVQKRLATLEADSAPVAMPEPREFSRSSSSSFVSSSSTSNRRPIVARDATTRGNVTGYAITGGVTFVKRILKKKQQTRPPNRADLILSSTRERAAQSRWARTKRTRGQVWWLSLLHFTLFYFYFFLFTNCTATSVSVIHFLTQFFFFCYFPVTSVLLLLVSVEVRGRMRVQLRVRILRVVKVVLCACRFSCDLSGVYISACGVCVRVVLRVHLCRISDHTSFVAVSVRKWSCWRMA